MKESSLEEIFKKYNIKLNDDKKLDPPPKNKRKQEPVKDLESSSEEEEKPIRKPKRKKKRHVRDYSSASESSDVESSDEEVDVPKMNNFTINRKMKSKLDAEGVELIQSLIKFIPRHGDQEQIWQQIKKCITLPPVQLYTKAAVMNYLKKQQLVG